MQIGPESDVVMSTRVRIARNFNGIPFPSKMQRRWEIDNKEGQGSDFWKKQCHWG
ncbi:ATP:guanido phosphotransferase YacI [Acetivibrio straminisolvens JCM 21531]|uniref:ATP:guanido phosphotransferase YacI n=1 Tax=Acetivibrio straminisolvens JCM 21531 TaxID=1294263 RepID=W4V8K4_9FIRM|nr:ATP:guanido phosphotransferase YacI [Acetivibrio straminisolvens JCM 21531]